MDIFRLALGCRIRFLSMRAVFSSRNHGVLSVCSTARSSVGVYRYFASDSTSQKPQRSEIAKPQRSILEEVLIKEKQKPKTTAQKVVQKAENTFFYAVLAVSVAALGALGYVLFEQFFSYESPQKIFSKALSMIQSDPACQEIFGPTIAGFGEESGRGRRRHVAHQKYEKDGRRRIRVVFHLKGPKARGVAQAEMENDGSWQWRFLLVQTHGPSPETHVLIDNRDSI